MRYSLLSRFQGALVGCALGEAWGGNNPQPSMWRAAIYSISEDLVRYGNWREESLLQGFHPLEPRPNDAEYVNPSTAFKSIAELALFALPISLFFHESEPKLWKNLSQMAWILRGHAADASGVAAVGYAIAQALRDQREPLRVIPAVVSYLRQQREDTLEGSILMERLEQVQQLLCKRADLRTALNQLLPVETSEPTVEETNAADASTIALSFYCCLSTPEDFRLSLMRAAHCHPRPHLICALTGAMSGAFNSVASIPLHMHLCSAPAQYLDNWKQVETDLYHLGACLLAAWSGAYISASSSLKEVAIAAPDVIRPR